MDLMLKFQDFLKVNRLFFPYSAISSVSVDTPLVGYSTIHFEAQGTYISVHGFTKNEVKQIKESINSGKSKGSVSTFSSAQNSPTPNNQKNSNDELLRINQIEQREQEEKIRVENKVEEIAEINISGTADEISQQLNKLFSIASSKPDKKIKNAIIEKIEYGLMKLRSFGSNTEADFFEKKLVPLKKKGLYDFIPQKVFILIILFCVAMLLLLISTFFK